MSAVNSPEGICNLAFDLLRHGEQVVSLSQPESKAEDLAARWYDTTRRAILGAFYWNFARLRAELSLNGTSPTFGYANAYNLPNNFLALLFIGDNYAEDYETEYAIENGQIVLENSAGASLNIGYICDYTNVIGFDPLFTELLICELAIRFANSLTGVNKSTRELRDWKKELEAKARSKNGRDNPPKTRDVSKIISKRRMLTQAPSSDGVHLFS